MSIDEEPDKRIRTFWAMMFILLPIALIFSDTFLSVSSICPNYFILNGLLTYFQ